MLKRLLISFLVVPFFGTALVGCSTTATVRGLSDLPNLPGGATGVVLPISLQADKGSVVAEDGCSLDFLKAGGLKTYDVDVPVGSDVLFAELPDGLYALKEIVCGHIHWDMTFHQWPHFEVFAGHVSVLAGVNIFLTSSQSLSSHLSNRERNRTESLQVIGRVPASIREKLVSGYTGTKIIPVNLETPAKWTHWKVDPLPKNEDDRSWPTFHACYAGEWQVNSLWLGQLDIDAVYEQGKLVSAEPGIAWNTFTEQFLKCAKDSLQDFHPRVQTRLQYKIWL